VHRTRRFVTVGDSACHTARVTRRFLTLADVAELLNVSASQAYALVRSGQLRGIKIGGRGQWRVEQSELERYIAERYEATDRYIAEHPFSGVLADDEEPSALD
jgi:excisionase family DNA binding protein